MKKFLLALLTAVIAVCLGAFVACTSNSGDYHLLVLRQANGVTYVSELNSGKGVSNGAWEVKDGVTVTFTIELSADATGEPVVYANNAVIEPDGNGVYSVTVTEDVDVRVEGIEASGTTYNQLIFAYSKGAIYHILTEVDGQTLQNGMMVRNGTQVQFKVEIEEGFYGTPSVYANGTKLEADGSGVYTFEMSERTTVKVEGIMKNVSYLFNTNGGDTRVKYLDEKGNYFECDKAFEGRLGDVIRFKLEISVYYVQSGFEVQTNNTIIKPEADGYYSMVLDDDVTTVSVTNLEQDEPYTARANGGSGSARDPYKLSRPIDLYQMAMLINSAYWTDEIYRVGYYELENDIDLRGEKLFVIGDGGNGYAYFAGSFKGNGHTISNFFIEDTRVEQTEFNTMYLSNVGMFGYVMSKNNRAPSISNLNLDNFTITASSSHSEVKDDYTLCVGSLAGAVFGAQISGVTATNGKINVTGGKNTGAYVGGLIGQQMSDYDESGTRLYSSVSFCMTDVDINVVGSNYVYATGGIVGAIGAAHPSYTAFIVNSYATGDIEGGQNAGGIVGYLAANTAVANCYSTGEVRAVSPFKKSSDYYESVYYANSGGIIGYAEYNTVISNSFSTGYISAQAEMGNSYLRISSTVGHTDDYLPSAAAVAPALVNLYGKDGLVVNQQLINDLHWSENDWSFAGDMPAIKADRSAASVGVTFSVDNGFAGGATPAGTTLNSYNSLASWYNNGKLVEYVTGNNGNRSYGYFFDAQLKNKVPASFVPTHDITLYVGYANYAEVEGVYYLGESVTDSSRLEFDADGNFIYRNGALNHASTYIWDGTNLVMFDTSIGELTKVQIAPEVSFYYFNTYYTFVATLANGAISITGGSVQEIATDESGNPYYTGETFYLFPEDQPLKGLKAIEGFHYGDYYDTVDIYTFNGNGSGRWKSANVREFTYYVSGEGKIVLTYKDDPQPVDVTFINGYVTKIGTKTVLPFDGFTGTWEKAFSTETTYTFDGKGAWTSKSYSGVDNGTYTVEDGVLYDSLNRFTATFKNGFLVISTLGANAQSLTYYKEGSFVGEWTYSGTNVSGSDVAITLTLKGISTENYGEARVEYSTGAKFDLTYEADLGNNSKSILLFEGGTQFGELTYDADNIVLSGYLYDSLARFTVLDDLTGFWVSDDDVIKTASFNGSGFYNLDSTDKYNSVKGNVRINESPRDEYTFDRDTLTGSFIYKSVTYTMAYDEYANVIAVSAENGRSFVLTMPDSWYNVELKDASGFVYSFNGMGDLAEGGTLTVSNGRIEDEYSYKYIINGNTLTLTGDGFNHLNATIAIGVDGNGKSVYVLEDTSGKKTYLFLNTPFAGEWIMGGMRGSITISDVYADNTATGTYKPYGKTELAVNFVYNAEGNYLSFIEGNITYYINALVSATATELSFGTTNSLFGANNVMCIPVGRVDEMYGKVFTTAEGYKLLFDGFTSSVFANGSVVVLDEDGELVTTYPYEYNKYGYPTVVLDRFWEYVFVSCEADTKFDVDVLYRLTDESGKHFAIISTDSLYTLSVRDGYDVNVYYEFDGAGNVTRTQWDPDTEEYTYTRYTYKIVKLDETNFKHTLEFKDEAGNVYTVTLDTSSAEQIDWNITFNTTNTLSGIAEFSAISAGV